MDWFSLGLAISAYSPDANQEGGETYPLRQGSDASATIGIYSSFLNKQLLFDSAFTYSTEQEYYLPPYEKLNTPASERVLLEAHYPAIWESTLTGVLCDRRLFIVGKEIVDFYTSVGAASAAYDRNGIMSRSIPSVELWPLTWLSLRAEYIFMYADIMGTSNMGHCGIGGSTLRLGTWDIDINYTMMERVSRILPGYTDTDQRLLLQISRHANFVRSR